MSYIRVNESAKEFLTQNGERFEDTFMDSIADEMKVDLFFENQHKFTLTQFEDWIKTLSK